MSWKSSLVQIVVGILTLLALLLGGVALPAETEVAAPGAGWSGSHGSVPESCVRVRRGNHVCSGTAVAASGELTLVISCNHCFADQPWPGGMIPRGKYPVECTIEGLSDGKRYDATAVDGDSGVDVALVVVRGGFAGTPARVARANVGDTAEHWGVSSHHATGRITRYDDSGRYPPDQSERAHISSIPGDSGAGLFVNGRLVAQNWGYWPGGEQGGTAVSYLLQFAGRSRQLRSDHPGLRDALPVLDDLPRVPTPVLPPSTITPVSPCPDGNGCWLSPWSRPRLLPLLPWRR